RIGTDGEEDSVLSLGKVYSAVLGFSVITRYVVFILPVAALLAVPVIVTATVAKDARADGVRLLGLFIWIEVVWFSLWAAKLIAQILPLIFQFFCGIISSGTRKYMLLLKAIEIPISLLIWTIICWGTVPVITTFEHTANFSWVVTLRRVFLASIAVAACFLCEKIIVQLIGINYHRKQFNVRIKNSKKRVHMLDVMYEASRKLFPAYCPEFIEDDYIILTGVDHRQNPKAAANIIGGIGWVGENVTSAFGNMASEITGQQVSTTAAHSIVVEALEMKTSTEALARRVWTSFVEEGNDALYPRDIVEILGEENKAEAEEIFDALDVDHNGDISLEEMVTTVVEIARERKDMARSMHDVSQAVRVLDRFLSCVVIVLIALIYAAFFSSSFAHYLATIGTQVAAVSFAIAGSVQEFLGSCIFLFIKHPYDVGDRVLINDTQLVVEHISLLYTVFRRIDNNRTVQVPNIVNNSTWIENVSRSKAMKEQLEIDIDAGTSFEDVELLRAELQMFVLAPENKRDFLPAVEIEILETDMKKLVLRVEVTHKSNWSNEFLRSSRRNKLMTALISATRAVPIYPPGGADAVLGGNFAPSYSVAVSKAEAEAARAEFVAQKEAKRM
ncbi:hypothetical protein NA57DRAFT_16756, partial [Rhizodiscina lignyota]